MAASAEFIAFAIEQMAGLGAVTARRMFGGAGLYRGPVMFALILDDKLYFRTDREGEARFAAAGLSPFTYATKHGERTVRAFWRAPLACLDDEEVVRWAEAAFAAAATAQRARKPAAKRAKTSTAKRRR
jgi:DNA transformation protein